MEHGVIETASAASPPPGASPPLIRLRDVTKRFGPVLAVDSVSLEIARGTFVTLLGPSGCGKTTTLRLLAGFYTPDAGTIEIGGRVVNNLAPDKRDAAMVFQDYALFPHMKVRENVAFDDMVSLVEGFGFKLVRRQGSHHIFSHPTIAELINLQERSGQAKPYQIRQFLKLAERYNLHLEDEA